MGPTVFSVTPDISTNSSLRGETPRHPAQDGAPQGGDFAALIDSNAVVANRSDRPAPSSSSDASPRRDDSSGPPDVAQRDGGAGNIDPSQNPSASNANPSSSSDSASKPTIGKQAKSTATASDEGDNTHAKALDTADPAVAATPIQSDATAAIAVAVPATPTAPATTPSSPANPTTSGPLTIAAAAIAASAKDTADAAMPTTSAADSATQAATGDAAAMTEAVAAAANDIAATNFKIAKTIETAPTPASTDAADANVNLQAQQQLGAAVAAADAGLVKTAQKASPVHRDDAAAAVAKALKPDDAGSTQTTSPQPGVTTQPDAKAAPQANDTTNTAKSDPAVAGDKPAANAVSSTEHRAANVNVPATSSIDVASQANNTVPQPQFVPTATTAVPASQLGAAVATGVAVPLNGLAIQIAANAQSGRSRFDIRLDPAELGRIDVRLDVDRHGQVTSHLVVEKAETLAMLRQDAPQLQRALEDAGLKTGNNGLQFSLRDQSSGNNGGNEQSGRQMHRLMIGDADTLPAVAAGKSYSQSSGSSRGLDIRV